MSSCQVCGGGGAEPLVTQDGFRWVRCRGCAFVFLDPMPGEDGTPTIDDDAMGEYYVELYRRKIRSKTRRTRKRARYLCRYARGDTILDIGSNYGVFTDCMRRLGKESYGIELNRAVTAFSREKFPGNNFICGSIEDHDFGGMKFDGFYCSEVIEHVTDVDRFVAGIAALARPGAAMYLTTPHVREFVTTASPETWRSFGAPDHKLYFNDDNLARLLARHGFRVIKNRYTFNKGIKLIAVQA